MNAAGAGAASSIPQAAARRRALWASVFALLLGSALTVLLHEGAHWVAGAALGSPSTLYSYGVMHGGSPSASATAAMALAGPALSLVLGLAMTFWLPLREHGGIGHLLWLWIGFTSLQEAVTYLVITPFGVGDTAIALEKIGGGNIVLAVVAMAVGIAGMFWQARRFAVHVRRSAGDDLVLARCFAWFPWLIGIGWLLILQLVMLWITPMKTSFGEGIIVALAGMSMTVFAPMAFIFLRRIQQPQEALRLPRFPTGLAIGYAVIVVVNVVLSFTGPTIG